MDFSNLKIQEAGNTSSSKVVNINIPQATPTKAIDFRTDLLGKAPKKTKTEIHLTEPGYKDPIANYGSVVQWCDECEEVRAFADKNSKGRMICLTCKTVRKYKTLK